MECIKLLRTFRDITGVIHPRGENITVEAEMTDSCGRKLYRIVTPDGHHIVVVEADIHEILN